MGRKRSLPSLRTYFFRLILVIGLLTSLVTSAAIGLGDTLSLRRMLIRDLEQAVSIAANGASFPLAEHDAVSLRRMMEKFRATPNLTRLCVYNPENRLVNEWPAGTPTACPILLIDEGTTAQFFTVHTNARIENNGTYLGMMRAEGELTTLRSILHRSGLVLAFMMTATVIACFFAARLSASRVTKTLGRIHTYLDCIAQDDGVCEILPKARTREAEKFMGMIVTLRSRFLHDRVPREDVEKLRRNHNALIADFCTGLSARLGVNGWFAAELADYRLLLAAHAESKLPADIYFSLPAVLDASLTSAKLLHPANRHIHFSISLTAGTPRNWRGQPELLEALLRNLLLIALRRTHNGFIRLSVDVATPAESNQPTALHFQLSDSGPPMQHWQLQEWLIAGPEELSDLSTETLPWQIAAHAARRLKGSLRAETKPGLGLVLSGWVTMATEAKRSAPVIALSAFRPNPLVLVVERRALHIQMIRHALEKAGCLAFFVQNHRQVIEWSVALPFSAILLNGTFSDSWRDTARRLRHMMYHAALPELGLWALLEEGQRTTLEDEPEGVRHLLSLPFRDERIAELCGELSPPARNFHHLQDAMVRHDLPPRAAFRLPELTASLLDALTALKEKIAVSFALGEAPVCTDAAHAVKSACLTLGYFRLAALMSEIEYATGEPQGFVHENWGIILNAISDAEKLGAEVFKPQNPAARVAVSS